MVYGWRDWGGIIYNNIDIYNIDLMWVGGVILYILYSYIYILFYLLYSKKLER